ncbi:hypothetical protein AWB81_03652 [Caballeronia arationis]|uniref:Secreted protein n=1 Tax=Caballeronia arationis TaxID=1777142 RepID=A0A7Z7IBN8_9BURK|nr:hypothetical protein [Caballeronia arationis]SAK76460.1 hypothetical protein AWB81_03652 [Caballeronia arationis]SOE81616.1 hypothetical protein SAMN05446927_4905 [Caballeronia arationis]
MKKQLLAVSLLAMTSSFAAPAFARDDGPRFASDLLDTHVAQHAEAARHIADRHPTATPAPTAVPASARTPQ